MLFVFGILLSCQQVKRLTAVNSELEAKLARREKALSELRAVSAEGLRVEAVNLMCVYFLVHRARLCALASCLLCKRSNFFLSFSHAKKNFFSLR
jgi:hypothetical protein